MTAKPPARRVILLGALSAIGQATGRLYAEENASLTLVGRNPERLSQVANDLLARGAARCHVRSMDLATVASPQAEIASMAEELGGPIDVIFLFFGVLGDHKLAENDATEARKIIDTNFTGAVPWCMAAANQLEQQGGGTLLAVSSVAGDRGRRADYVYGAAKAGLTTLLQGLAHRLAHANARAVVVKLGFVDTPMTAHIKKSGPLWATPAGVAMQIKAAADQGTAPVVYIPRYWRWIMLGIRSAPAALFHKTKL